MNYGLVRFFCFALKRKTHFSDWLIHVTVSFFGIGIKVLFNVSEMLVASSIMIEARNINPRYLEST